MLTTDIVWLQQETVNLPDGTQTVALVPHLYAAVRAGDLNAQGGLLSSNTVSKVSVGKDLTITAGQNVIAKAADLKAKGDASITAQGTVLLNAGQTRSSYDAVLTKSSSDLISTTTTQTQTQASAAMAKLSQVQGQNVNIVAGQHLISVGTQFKGSDSLRVDLQAAPRHCA